jgi:tRNA(Ile)-lysidine synthase
MKQASDRQDNLVEQADKLTKLLPHKYWHPDALEYLSNKRENEKIGIACSGGADSTFCLFLIFAALPQMRSEITVAHYNHKLRGKDSDDDEAFVQKMSLQLGLKFISESDQLATQKTDENSLRKKRLLFWEKLNQEKQISIIIQGHQLDDIAETLLWRIPRGVSTDGLISPKPVSKLGSVTILRPFIGIDRRFIRESLKKVGLHWREDTSNLENTYLRNKIRKKVLPAWKKCTDRDLLKGVESTVHLLREDSCALDFHAEETLNRCSKANKINLELLKRFPWATQRRVLTKWIVQNRPGRSDLSAKAVNLKSLIVNSVFTSVQLSDDCTVIKKSNFLIIEEKYDPIEVPTISLPFNQTIYLANGLKVFAEKRILNEQLHDLIFKKKVDQDKEAFLGCIDSIVSMEVRSRIAGDKYFPLGAPGSKKLSDWMIDRKWSDPKKIETPCFVKDGEEILWVPGFPPALKHRVNDSDKWVIRLTYQLSST